VPAPFTCAASTLVAEVLGARDRWVEAVRTSLSVHYETGHAVVPVVCVGLPAAVRLPYGVVVPRLPPGPPARSGPPDLAVTRWWTPPRPSGLVPPAASRWWRWARWLTEHDHVLDPHALVGNGDGLTPAGDDVLAGALVAGHAVDHPDLDRLRRATRSALADGRTTAVSTGMLHAALGGWSSPQLADAVTDLCGAADPAPAVDRLLAVGHSSGRHLLDGVLRVLSTHPLSSRGAA
jgi:Protein of unknown function (DUF2877)